MTSFLDHPFGDSAAVSDSSSSAHLESATRYRRALQALQSGTDGTRHPFSEIKIKANLSLVLLLELEDRAAQLREQLQGRSDESRAFTECGSPVLLARESLQNAASGVRDCYALRLNDDTYGSGTKEDDEEEGETLPRRRVEEEVRKRFLVSRGRLLLKCLFRAHLAASELGLWFLGSEFVREAIEVESGLREKEGLGDLEKLIRWFRKAKTGMYDIGRRIHRGSRKSEIMRWIWYRSEVRELLELVVWSDTETRHSEGIADLSQTPRNNIFLRFGVFCLKAVYAVVKEFFGFGVHEEWSQRNAALRLKFRCYDAENQAAIMRSCLGESDWKLEEGDFANLCLEIDAIRELERRLRRWTCRVPLSVLLRVHGMRRFVLFAKECELSEQEWRLQQRRLAVEPESADTVEPHDSEFSGGFCVLEPYCRPFASFVLPILVRLVLERNDMDALQKIVRLAKSKYAVRNCSEQLAWAILAISHDGIADFPVSNHIWNRFLDSRGLLLVSRAVLYDHSVGMVAARVLDRARLEGRWEQQSPNDMCEILRSVVFLRESAFYDKSALPSVDNDQERLVALRLMVHCLGRADCRSVLRQFEIDPANATSRPRRRRLASRSDGTVKCTFSSFAMFILESSKVEEYADPEEDVMRTEDQTEDPRFARARDLLRSFVSQRCQVNSPTPEPADMSTPTASVHGLGRIVKLRRLTHQLDMMVI